MIQACLICLILSSITSTILDIVHFTEDAIYFFNSTFGLDFSTSMPTDQHEFVFENARMSPYMFSEDVSDIYFNNWIRTGSTHSTCTRLRHGGFRALFSGDQTLYGSYGGVEGKPAGLALFYSLLYIEGCQQSPVIILGQSSTPFRVEPVDGTGILNQDLYNNVLGYRKSHIMVSLQPDQYDPSKYCLMTRHVISFPA